MSRQSSPGAAADNPESSPLSAEELEAINALAKGGLNQEQIAKDAASAANALAEAVQPSGNAVANTEEDGSQDDDEGKPLDVLEALLEKDDDKVANNGPGGKDCEAKSEASCRCGEKGGKYVPITLPDPISPQEAIERLKRGIKVTNPLGEDVLLGQEMLDHWEGDDQRALEKGRQPMTQREKDARLSALPLIEKVIESPKRILQNPDGSRTYEAEAIDKWKPKGKHYIVSFTKSDDTTILKTYRINDRYTNKGGEQIWPDTSGT